MIVYMTPTATYTQSYLVGWSGTVTFHWNKGAPKDGVTIWYLPVLSPSKPPSLWDGILRLPKKSDKMEVYPTNRLDGKVGIE